MGGSQGGHICLWVGADWRPQKCRSGSHSSAGGRPAPPCSPQEWGEKEEAGEKEQPRRAGGGREGGAGGGAGLRERPRAQSQHLGAESPPPRRVRPEGAGPARGLPPGLGPPSPSFPLLLPSSSPPSFPSQQRPQSPSLAHTKAKCPPSSKAAAPSPPPARPSSGWAPGPPLPRPPPGSGAAAAGKPPLHRSARPPRPPRLTPCGRRRTTSGGGEGFSCPRRRAPGRRPPHPLDGPFTLMQYGGSS